MEDRLDLRELLSIPYLLEAEAVEAGPGKWLLRLAYPELPGCAAEGFVVEDVLRDLERRRVEMIVSLVEAGKEPPSASKTASLASDPRSGPKSTISVCRPALPLFSEGPGNSRRDAALTGRFDGESSCCRSARIMKGW